MAVDAIIVAARKGDTIALKYLAGYDIPDAAVRSGKLGELRDRVLGVIGVEADPLTSYQKFKAAANKTVGQGKAAVKKLDDTGKLAALRTSMDGKSRGFGWRLKMMFKGEDKFSRSQLKTDTLALVVVGRTALPHTPTPDQVDAFIAAAKKLTLEELQEALADPRNADPEAQDTLSYIIADKAAEQASGVPGRSA